MEFELKCTNLSLCLFSSRRWKRFSRRIGFKMNDMLYYYWSSSESWEKSTTRESFNFLLSIHEKAIMYLTRQEVRWAAKITSVACRAIKENLIVFHFPGRKILLDNNYFCRKKRNRENCFKQKLSYKIVFLEPRATPQKNTLHFPINTMTSLHQARPWRL